MIGVFINLVPRCHALLHGKWMSELVPPIMGRHTGGEVTQLLIREQPGWISTQIYFC